MSAIDEGIVREFFEQTGFRPPGPQVPGAGAAQDGRRGDRPAGPQPGVAQGGRKPRLLLFSTELQFVHQAVVAVKPWHTDVFTPAMLKGSPEIFGFLEQNVLKHAARLFPQRGEGVGGDVTRYLSCPASHGRAFRSQSVAMLQERGVDGIISFRSMLLDLIEKIDANRNYGKSDTLQVIQGPEDLRPAEGRPAGPAERPHAIGRRPAPPRQRLRPQ